MLDRKYILANVEEVKTNCVNRGVQCDVDKLVDLETERKEKDLQSQEFNRLANEISKKDRQSGPKRTGNLERRGSILQGKKGSCCQDM